jgi:hypothetical protein
MCQFSRGVFTAFRAVNDYSAVALQQGLYSFDSPHDFRLYAARF